MNPLYKPDFIVAGPAKTGTTWLYRQLHFVAGFKLPPVKEISFFNEVYFDFILKPENKYLWGEYKLLGHEITPDFIRRSKENITARRLDNVAEAFKHNHFLWALYYRFIPHTTSRLSFRLYCRLFNQSPDFISGDISPLYFTLSTQIISLIAKRFPKLKVVFILRDPVEREWSNIRMNYFSGQNDKGFSIQSYIQKHNFGANYKRCLTNWETYFDKSRIQYLFYDDLQNDPAKFLQSFIDIIKPDAKVRQLIFEPVGQGINKAIEPAIRAALLKKNMPQYEFLADKFGPHSYPAAWKIKAFTEL